MRTITTFVALVATLISFAGNNPDFHRDPYAITYVSNPQKAWDFTLQQQLRESAAWQNFKLTNPGWNVVFNERSGLPHRAFGKAIPAIGNTPQEQAEYFIASFLNGFDLPIEEFVFKTTYTTGKYSQVEFIQVHEGMEVYDSRIAIKIGQAGVVMFGTDAYEISDLNTIPVITADDAAQVASFGIDMNILSTYSTASLKILPIGASGQFTSHLVYESWVKAENENGVPARYQCFVDAHSGEILYRYNTIYHITACDLCNASEKGKKDEGKRQEGKKVLTMGMMTVEGTLTGEAHALVPFVDSEELELPNLAISIDGSTVYTDDNGMFSSPAIGPVSAQFELEGLWSSVNTNDITPSFTIQLAEGTNNVSFTGEANVKEISAYRSVNLIHDHMKQWLPNFTGLDYAMPTNIDVAGECNAYYDGEINFFDAGGGCNATSLIADVVYHEYGHGINNIFYDDNNMGFNNGAMHEGYADFWAISLTGNPIIGPGFFANSEDGIRRYDIDPKVYPQDLVGEVHADGEIICGAWYDTHLLMGGDWDATMALFAETYAGFQATGMNGTEGQLYFDVLLDCLQADDDNDDIEDGTPNDLAIIEGFAIHGIYLLAGAEIDHENVLVMPDAEVINIEADIQVQFPYGIYLEEVKLYYRVNDQATWSETTMVNVQDELFEAEIPAQEQGNVIAYYISLVDIYGNQTGTTPVGANQDDPTLPYFTIVGMETVLEHDSDLNSELGVFETGVAGDLATAGQWEVNVPIGSYFDPLDESTIASPDHQHTPGDDGEFCFITGQASLGGSVFDTDVDDGGTTLESPNVDLTDYEMPVISYWRWLCYQPAGSGQFVPWYVDVSDDGGNTWVSVEETFTQDRAWRRNVIRVEDYVDITDEFRIRFIADDPIFQGSGGLVEAAVDDIYIWDSGEVVSVADNALVEARIWPNPATDQLYLLLPSEVNPVFRIFDQTGREVLADRLTASQEVIDIATLADGCYVISFDEESGIQPVTFIKR